MPNADPVAITVVFLFNALFGGIGGPLVELSVESVPTLHPGRMHER